MKTGRSLVDLAQELERQNNAKADYLADSRATKMRVDLVEAQPIIQVDGIEETFGIRPQAHRQIGTRAGIPAKYYDKMMESSPGLLCENVNHWWENAAETRMLRTLDGKLRAFLSDRYRPIDNYDLAGVLLPIIQQAGCQIKSCEVTEQKMYIKAIAYDITTDIKVGDKVAAGLSFTNSETGHGSVSVFPFIERLVCLNGMRVNDAGLRKFHVGSNGNTQDLGQVAEQWIRDETRVQMDKAFFAQLTDVTSALLSQDGLEKLAGQFREAAETDSVGDPVKVVEQVSQKLRLTEDEQGGVLRHLIEGGDLTQWGFANAITRHSADVESYDRASELEALGFAAIELPKADFQVLSI